jgi:hypothetical protein
MLHKTVVRVAVIAALIGMLAWGAYQPAPSEERFGAYADLVPHGYSVASLANWMQGAAWFGAVLAAVVAVMALLQRVDQARATFLLHLDDHWNRIRDARDVWRTIQNEIATRAKIDHSAYRDKHRMEELRRMCGAKMNELKTSNPGYYWSLFECIGFFETAGLMVRRGYVPLSDMVGNFKGPILDVDIMFLEHIAELQKLPEYEPGLFENALFLAQWTKRQTSWPWLLFWM